MAGLSDLIRRRGASRLLDGHPLQVWEQSIPVPPTEASSGPGDRALRDRRKMTVRLPMDEFQWLDGLAKSSGRTYQSILEEATATLHRQRLYG